MAFAESVGGPEMGLIGLSDVLRAWRGRAAAHFSGAAAVGAVQAENTSIMFAEGDAAKGGSPGDMSDLTKRVRAINTDRGSRPKEGEGQGDKPQSS